ncbi:MAG: hypothetical protein JWQ43_3480, partial [Glaciihabitans sp.]|nr:hypothetical protein [Glaciihabitans sp.]
MSMRAVSVSSAARRRIRTFSIWLWVWGAVVLSIGAFGTFTNVGFGGNGLGIIGANGNPWDDADPTVFEPVGTTYSGDGSGVIRIPLEEHNQDAYAVTLVTGDYVDLYVTPASDINQPATDRGYPDTIAYIYGPDDIALVLPEEADLELWVRSDDAWEFTLEKAEFTEITDGFASGS